MFNLKIIIASTRPGNWIFDFSKSNPESTAEVLDLAEINLPFLDERNHLRLQKYDTSIQKTGVKRLRVQMLLFKRKNQFKKVRLK